MFEGHKETNMRRTRHSPTYTGTDKFKRVLRAIGLLTMLVGIPAWVVLLHTTLPPIRALLAYLVGYMLPFFAAMLRDPIPHWTYPLWEGWRSRSAVGCITLLLYGLWVYGG